MTEMIDLPAYLSRWAEHDPDRKGVAATITGIASACTRISTLIAHGPLAGAMGQQRASRVASIRRKRLMSSPTI